MYYIAERGRSALKGAVIDTEPQNWGALGLRLFGMRAWLTPNNKPPSHVCYHVKFSTSIYVKG